MRAVFIVLCHFWLSVFLFSVSTSQAQQIQAHRGVWAGARTIKGNEAKGYVAFTFDDGPDLRSTPKILDILEKFSVPASFFVVGKRFAKNNPSSQKGAQLILEMAARGFTIGNHSSRHQRLDQASFAIASESIEHNARALERLLGYAPALFRPPFGATTSKIRRLLKRRGDTLVRWNIDPQDFRARKAKGLRARVLQDILKKEGGIVLLHDTKPWTAAALEGILQDLRSTNCDRIRAGKMVILPVSLHYFLRDLNGSPRPIPPEIMNNTQKQFAALTKECEKGN